MIGVDLFSGAGGMSLGAAWAGVSVRLAVEADPHAAATYRHNHPKTGLFADDICGLKVIDVPREGHHTVLFGGPPCQGFSTSNQRTRSRDNPNNWLFREFTRLAAHWGPDWVVFENVQGIAGTAAGTFLAEVLKSLEAIGYTTSTWTLNAVDFGVPQVRSRLFVIGSASGLKVEKPPPLASRLVTVHQAISDLPTLGNGAPTNWMPYKCPARTAYAKSMRNGQGQSSGHLVTRNARYVLARYKHVPRGGNWEDIPARLMKNYADRYRCHTGIYQRLRGDRPSVVIGNYRKNMLIHPYQDRGLSVREAARLQSFPDWYEFEGSIGFQQQQVGNAVPPLLAKKVFQCILDAQDGR
jgi:DNA (cytosine-5)-methyltransferase 1